VPPILFVECRQVLCLAMPGPPDAASGTRRLLLEESWRERVKRRDLANGMKDTASDTNSRKCLSIANIGEESGKMLTPSARLRQYCRYHEEQKSPTRAEPTPREAAYLVNEQMRFHRSRSYTPDKGNWRRNTTISLTGAGKPQSPRGEPSGDAAGVPSNRRSRYDTPAGMSSTLGHTRLSTPDYHRKYEANASGTTLPGCRGNAAGIVSTPRGRRPAEGGPLAPTHQALDSCRFHLSREEPTGNRPRSQLSMSSYAGLMTPRGTYRTGC